MYIKIKIQILKLLFGKLDQSIAIINLKICDF